MQTTTQVARTFIKVDENRRLTKGIEYASGARIEIPINKDGSVRWFDDNRLLKTSV